MATFPVLIEPFDVQNGNWKSYSERFDQIFICNGITTPEQKRAHLLGKIGPEAYELLKTLCSPILPSAKTYEELVSELACYFQPSRIEIAERYAFYNRKQHDTESLTQYLAALRKLAEHCNFGANLNTALRDAFVIGLQSENIRKNLLKERSLTLQTATDLAMAAESVEQNLKNMKALQSRSSAFPTNRVVHHSTKGKTFPNPTSLSKGANPQAAYAAKYEHGKVCHRCGDPGHYAPQCTKASGNTECFRCHRKGHLSNVCNNGKRFPSYMPKRGVGRSTHQVNECEYDHDIGTVVEIAEMVQSASGKGPSKNPPIQVPVKVNGVPVNAELDTGASLTIMGETEFNHRFPMLRLQPTSVQLRDYNQQPIQAKGSVTVRVECNGQLRTLPLIVVRGSRPTLFGRNWLQAVQLDWSSVLRTYSVNQASSSPEFKSGLPTFSSLKSEFPDVFSPGLGCWKGPPARLHLKPGAIPRFHKPRGLPFALREPVSEQLDCMVSNDILESVDHAKWAAPVVPVRKANGQIRLCGDFKVTVNPHLDVDQYPLPRNEEVFAELSGGELFSVLDMSQAFLQIPLDEESQNLLVINTHKGLFRFKRLAFGPAPAPAILQKRMEALIKGIPHTAVRTDDIIVTGATTEEHAANLREVLRRFQAAGLKLNPDKCQLFQKQVTYLGHLIDCDGIRPSPKNTDAIRNCSPPKSADEVASFIGMVQYYARFIPNLATLSDPLNALRRKGVKFQWTSVCEKAFTELKEKISSAGVLTHYRQDLPLIVQCDASPVGLGAFLSHIMPDGTERPICAASKTLTPTERNYSQLDREAYAVVFGITRFHQFTYGRKFILRTDNKPLSYLFKPTAGIPTTASSRLQRWAYKIQGYNYDVEHIPGSKNGNADALSRLPVNMSEGTSEDDDFSVLSIISAETGVSFDVTRLAIETASDPVLSKCLRFTLHGWPQKLSTAFCELQPFFSRRLDLSCEEGCLLMGNRLVIPTSMRQEVLEDLHSGHPGITRMKMAARAKVWWPSMDSHIEAKVKQCSGCATTGNRPVDPSRSNQWPPATEQWERIHLDFAEPRQGKSFLIAVDAQSNWPEIVRITPATSENTVIVLRDIFCRMGIPRTIVTDNGTPFTSSVFVNFCQRNGIRHLRTAPYHPSSNGEAERMVQTFKRALKSMSKENGDEVLKIQRFLFSYRNTPSPTTGKSPADLLFGRPLRSRLDQLFPRGRVEDERHRISKPRINYGKNDKVWVMSLRLDLETNGSQLQLYGANRLGFMKCSSMALPIGDM